MAISDPSSAPDDAPKRIDRRESLRRATGVLALGLGAPSSLLAAEVDASPHQDYKLVFYGRDGEPLSEVDLPEREARILTQEPIYVIKFYQTARGRPLVTYRLQKIE